MSPSCSDSLWTAAELTRTEDRAENGEKGSKTQGNRTNQLIQCIHQINFYKYNVPHLFIQSNNKSPKVTQIIQMYEEQHLYLGKKLDLQKGP